MINSLGISENIASSIEKADFGIFGDVDELPDSFEITGGCAGNWTISNGGIAEKDILKYYDPIP
jgi:hypothetical protein